MRRGSGDLGGAVERVTVPVLRHQHRLIHSRAPNLAMPAGYGAGKSHGVALKALTLAMIHAHPRHTLAGLVVEPVYRMVMRVLVPAFRQVFDELGLLEGVDWRLYKQEQRIHVHLGDGYRFDIYLGSADRPETLAGTTLCFVILDEAGLMKQEAFDRTQTRLREGRANQEWLQFIAAGTPEGFGAFYDFAEGGPPKGLELIRACTDDNHHLPAGYFDRFGHMGEADLAMYRRGEFVARGGRVYDFYDAASNQVTLEEAGHDPFGGELVMSVDVGMRTGAYAMGTIYDGDTLHVWGELVPRQESTMHMLPKARQWWESSLFQHTGSLSPWSELSRQITVHCDAAGDRKAPTASETDHEMFAGEGYNLDAPKQNPGILDRIYSVNAALKEGRLLIDAERAPYLASCLRQQGWDRHTQTPERKEDDGSGSPCLSHGADAVGYGVWARWPVEAPRANVTSWAHH